MATPDQLLHDLTMAIEAEEMQFSNLWRPISPPIENMSQLSSLQTPQHEAIFPNESQNNSPIKNGSATTPPELKESSTAKKKRVANKEWANTACFEGWTVEEFTDHRLRRKEMKFKANFKDLDIDGKWIKIEDVKKNHELALREYLKKLRGGKRITALLNYDKTLLNFMTK